MVDTNKIFEALKATKWDGMAQDVLGQPNHKPSPLDIALMKMYEEELREEPDMGQIQGMGTSLVAGRTDLQGLPGLPPGFKVSSLGFDVKAVAGSSGVDAIEYSTLANSAPYLALKPGAAAESDNEENEPFEDPNDKTWIIKKPSAPLAIEPAKADEKLDNKDVLELKVE